MIYLPQAYKPAPGLPVGYTSAFLPYFCSAALLATWIEDAVELGHDYFAESPDVPAYTPAELAAAAERCTLNAEERRRIVETWTCYYLDAVNRAIEAEGAAPLTTCRLLPSAGGRAPVDGLEEAPEVALSRDEARRLRAVVDRGGLESELRGLVRQQFADREGFISYYSPDLREWPADAAEWTAVQLRCLFETLCPVEDLLDRGTSHFADAVREDVYDAATCAYDRALQKARETA